MGVVVNRPQDKRPGGPLKRDGAAPHASRNRPGYRPMLGRPTYGAKWMPSVARKPDTVWLCTEPKAPEAPG